MRYCRGSWESKLSISIMNGETPGKKGGETGPEGSRREKAEEEKSEVSQLQLVG